MERHRNERILFSLAGVSVWVSVCGGGCLLVWGACVWVVVMFFVENTWNFDLIGYLHPIVSSHQLDKLS